MQGSFLKPKTEGRPEGTPAASLGAEPGLALALTKLLRQRVFAAGLCLLLLGAHVVVLEDVGQLVPQHRDVWEGPHEGQLAIQVHLGHLQGWAAHKGPLAPAVHLGVPPLPHPRAPTYRLPTPSFPWSWVGCGGWGPQLLS